MLRLFKRLLRLALFVLGAPVAGLRAERALLNARQAVVSELGPVYDALRASYAAELDARLRGADEEELEAFAAARVPKERRLKELKARYAELDADAPEWAIR